MDRVSLRCGKDVVMVDGQGKVWSWWMDGVRCGRAWTP